MSDEEGECDSRTKRQQCPVAPISRPAHHSSSTMYQYHQKDWNWIRYSWTLYYFQVWIILSPVFLSLSSLSWVSSSFKCTWTHKDALIASFLYCCCCGLHKYPLFVKTSTSTESFLKSLASVLVVLMNTEQGLSTKIQILEKVIDDLACEQKWTLSWPLVVWIFCRPCIVWKVQNWLIY